MVSLTAMFGREYQVVAQLGKGAHGWYEPGTKSKGKDEKERLEGKDTRYGGTATPQGTPGCNLGLRAAAAPQRGRYGRGRTVDP